MPTEEELATKRRRRGYWLRLARRGMNQAGVAEAIGLSRNSASTISDWERGEYDPSLRQLEQLAALYQVPLSVFIDPPQTDEERLNELATGAVALALEDLEAGEPPLPGAGDGPTEPPRKRSA